MRMRVGWLIVAVVMTLGLGGAPGLDRCAVAESKPRITTFTITPAESLPPRPRTKVDTAPLAVPPPPPSMVVAAMPLGPDQILGRWTERDPRYCQNGQYVVEWLPDRLRLVLDGRVIDGGRVRYATDGATLKIERLTDAGEVDAYWRLEGIDGEHVEWVETAERRGEAIEVIAKPDKTFVRCVGEPEPPRGLFARWWAGFVERLWPPPRSEAQPASAAPASDGSARPAS